MAGRSASSASSAAEEARRLSTVDGLVQLSFLILGTLERRAAEHGLSLTQTRLLGVLRDRTPPMTELATLLGLDKSSITGLVDRAERRELVQRAASKADGRAVLVSLTDSARVLISRLAAEFEADVAAILRGLRASDREALTRIATGILVTHARSDGIDLFATTAPHPADE